MKALHVNCACVYMAGNQEAARTDKLKSNSSDHRKSSVDQESAAAVGLNPSTPRHSVRFADSSPPSPPAQTTAGVDVHDAGVSSSPPDSANSVKAVDTQQQQPTGARSLTARISSAPGKSPKSVAV